MKALWQESLTNWIPYNSSVHLGRAWIFVYWEKEELLLIGWRQNLQHMDLCGYYRPLTPQSDPNGAGRIWDGQVQSWRSNGFNLLTPESMRPKIIEALGIKE